MGVVALHLLRLSLCHFIQQLDRKCYLAMKEIFDAYYIIPYLLAKEEYSPLQLRLLHSNCHSILYHSSWIRSVRSHQQSGLLPQTKEGTHILCSSLFCPPLCDQNSDMWDDLALLDKDALLAKEEQKDIVDSLTTRQVEMLLPYLVRHCNPEHLIEVITKHKDKWHSTFRYEIHFLFDVIRSSQQLHYFLGLDPNLVMRSVNGANCLTQILVTPQAKVLNAYEIIEPFMRALASGYERKTSVKYSLRSIEILQARTWLVHLLVVAHSEAERKTDELHYLALLDGYYSACVLSRCARSLATLTKIQIVIPHVFILGGSVAVLELPRGAQLSAPLKDMKRPSTNPPPIEAYAAFVAFSYLLGLSEKKIAYSDNGLFHIDYSRAYYKNKMRLSHIINELGGRTSNYYKQFIIVTIGYFMMLRKYYKVAMLYLPLISIKRIDVDERFQPRLDDQSAEEFYRQKLTEQGDYAVRKWRHLGY